MSKHLHGLLRLRSKSTSQTPVELASDRAETQTPRRICEIQAMQVEQTLCKHFAQDAKIDQLLGVEMDDSEELMNSTASSKSWGVYPGLSSSSTQQLEQELLARQFQEALTEVERRGEELRDMVVDIGEPQDHAQQELQRVYRKLMKSATELFATVAQKMSRLRTKMDLRSSGAHQTCRGKCSSEQAPQCRKQSDCTQHRSWLQPRAPQRSPIGSSHFRRDLPKPSCGRKDKAERNEPRPASVSSASGLPKQWGKLQVVAAMHPYMDEAPCAPRQDAAGGEGKRPKVRSDAQPLTDGDLPQCCPDELLELLGQPQTLPELPHMSACTL